MRTEVKQCQPTLEDLRLPRLKDLETPRMKLRRFVAPFRRLRVEEVAAEFYNALETAFGEVQGPGETLSLSTLNRLSAFWGNARYSADGRFLERVCDMMGQVSGGTVLECGSGVSTVVLHLMAARRNIRVVSLEHLRQFHSRTGKALSRCFGDASTRNLIRAPLVSYGAFSWYDQRKFAELDDIRLVVCDGPPGITRGTRYGLLPVMRAKLRPDCEILLDDLIRTDEQTVVRLWQREFGISYTRHATERGAVTIRLPGFHL